MKIIKDTRDKWVEVFTCIWCGSVVQISNRDLGENEFENAWTCPCCECINYIKVKDEADNNDNLRK